MESSKKLKLEPHEDCTPHPHLSTSTPVPEIMHQVEVRSKEFEEDKRKREIWPTNSGVADGWGVHMYIHGKPSPKSYVEPESGLEKNFPLGKATFQVPFSSVLVSTSSRITALNLTRYTKCMLLNYACRMFPKYWVCCN